VLFLGAVAVLGALGALVRYYSRVADARRTSADAAAEIPAPELLPLPTSSPSPP
jgi:hypothetical protein